jgi:hypothetical protein
MHHKINLKKFQSINFWHFYIQINKHLVLHQMGPFVIKKKFFNKQVEKSQS